jgi:hypothetical protein
MVAGGTLWIERVGDYELVGAEIEHGLRDALFLSFADEQRIVMVDGKGGAKLIDCYSAPGESPATEIGVPRHDHASFGHHPHQGPGPQLWFGQSSGRGAGCRNHWQCSSEWGFRGSAV